MHKQRSEEDEKKNECFIGDDADDVHGSDEL